MLAITSGVLKWTVFAEVERVRKLPRREELMTTMMTPRPQRLAGGARM